MRASRLLSILILLQVRGRLTAETLAREFEVSARTIHRDLLELSAAGVPVVAERGHGGGYRLLAGFGTRLNGLLADEALALPLLGLPGAAGELGLGNAPRRAQHKLLAALPGDAAVLAGQLQRCFHIDPLDWYREPEPVPHLPQLAQAMLDARRVEVRYQAWQGERHWVLEPVGLVLKAGAWYAVVRKGGRIFQLKVAAITHLELRAEHFEPPREFALGPWWAQALERFERELRPLRAQLRASAEGCRRLCEQGAYARSAVAQAHPEANGGWMRLELPVESALQAARLVLAHVPELELSGPAPLRAELASLAGQMARRHRPSA